MEHEYGAHNYHPLPVVFSKAEGVYVWDPEGKRYYDFLSAYSAVNQGHGHPKILKAFIEQAQKCALSSRAFHNDMFPQYAKYITKYFGYESVLPMNTGAEAVETALKIARRWAYEKKGVPDNESIIISCTGGFHGRTIGIISMSDDPEMKHHFGPFVPGLARVTYGDITDLEKLLDTMGKKVAGFLVEPIQGEAGVVVPPDGYLAKSYELCKKHNVLFIADEIQTGLARTGKLLACDWEKVRPDILILGKALSGGIYPVSAVLADKYIMGCITPGSHGSTYGGNPLACATAIAALEVIKEEKLAQNAFKLGEKFRKELTAIGSPLVDIIRGKGLLNAITINEKYGKSAWEICVELKERGLLAKPTHNTIIRLAPPLIISETQLDECVKIIKSTLNDFATAKKEEKKATQSKSSQGKRIQMEMKNDH